MDKRVRWLGFALLLAVAMAGCRGAAGPETRVLVSEDEVADALAEGIALAPTGSVRVNGDAATVAAVFSNAIYIEAMTQLRGVDVVSPDLVLERLGEGGERTLEQFRQLRRRLVRDDRLPAGLTVELGQAMRERYLFVSWTEEKQVVGLEDMPGDYVDAGFSVDVQRASYAQIDGLIVGCLLDMQRSRILWQGQAHYRSGRNFANEDGAKSGEQLAREQGAIDLVELLRTGEY